MLVNKEYQEIKVPQEIVVQMDPKDLMGLKDHVALTVNKDLMER